MESKQPPIADERAIESGQQSRASQVGLAQANVGYYEPGQLPDLSQQGRLYIIADSLAGHASGQMVTQFAIQKTLHLFYTNPTLAPKARLQDTIQQVNKDIFDYNSQHLNQRPISTTLTAALLHNNKLMVVNVGDNRVYVVWGQDIERLEVESAASSVEPPEPKDSTRADESAPLLLGAIPPDSPNKETKVTKANPTSHRERWPQVLGLDQQVKIETFTPRRLFPADIVILCSGNLTSYVSEQELAKAVTKHSPAEAIPRLLALAAERGNQDSLAVSVNKVLSSAVALQPPMLMPLPPDPQWRQWLPQGTAKAETKPQSVPVSAKVTKPVVPTIQQKTGATPIPTRSLTPTPAQSVTQPLVGKKNQTQPNIEVEKPNYIKEKKPNRRWLGCLAGLLVTLCVCAVPLLAWQFALPEDIKASIPYFSDLETLLAGPTEPNEPTIYIPPAPTVEGGSASDTESLNTAAITATTTLTESTSTPLVVENNSPVATPAQSGGSTFSSPISPVRTPTTAPSPTPTEAAATISPTPQPTITLPDDCENKARFVGDVTVLDGTEFKANDAFEKVWELTNYGDCPWGPGYTVRFVEGEAMNAGPNVALTETFEPQSNAQIRVSMAAPSQTGSHRGEWQLVDLSGEPFGPVMYLEIEVVAPELGDISGQGSSTLYDFITNADQATWQSGADNYTVQSADINEQLELPFPQGIVATGPGLLRGNIESKGDVLLTYPDFTIGLMQGTYPIDTPLEPTDAFVAEIGFPKLSILSDDGVTFEATFTPTGGSEQLILSHSVQYRDSPITEVVPLTAIQSGQTGTITLRVIGGESLNQDWAVWIEARLVRP